MPGPSAHRSLLEFLTGNGSALIRAREHLLDLSSRVAGTGRLRPSQAAETLAPLLGLTAVDPGSVDLGASARSPLAGALAALLRGVLPSETAAEQVSLGTTDATASPATAPASVVATATATVRDLMAEHEHGTTSDQDQDHSHDHDHSDGVCAELPRYESLVAAEGAIAGGVSISAGTPLVAFADTFRLSSNPTARTTIYLDFDGHTTTGTSWNNATMGSSFYSPAYNTDGNVAVFSSTELTLIQRAWQRVAADFAPFDVNVTTMAPLDDWLIKTNASDPNYGIRVVMTSYGPSSSTAGGIAYIDSFNWNSDTPCFVYNTSLIGVSEAVSHEVGHTLGLSHDGTVLGGASYYSGHGSGESGWASIMGVGYYQSVTQWDDGTFYDSNNGGSGANYNKGPDDLAIITNYNGFGYLPDQEGNSQATANALSIQAGGVSQYGTIETRSDLDWYSFTLAAAGSISLNFDPYWYRTFIDTDGAWGGAANPYYARVSDASTSTAWADNGANLDLAVELYNSANVLLATANPTGLAASLNLTGLAADRYYLKLDGVGFGSPTVNPASGYSDYASIGSYLISGTITGPDTVPEITLALGPNFSVAEDGTTNLVWTFSRTGDTSAELAVNVTLGGTATNGTDYTLAGWIAGTLSFLAGQATATVTADPTPDTSQEGDETVSLQIASGSGYTIATTSAVIGTINNDDVPVVTLTVAPASVNENSGTALVYTFTRTGPTGSALTVNYAVGGTATVGSDYSGIASAGSVKTVTFAAGAATATVNVTPIGDTTVEAHESVALTLQNGSGYAVGTTSTVVGTILNDDRPSVTLSLSPSSVTEGGSANLVFTFTRSVTTADPLTVSYSVGGTATTGVDYTGITTGSGNRTVTIAGGAASAQVIVDPSDDTAVESNETVTLTLASGSDYTVGTTAGVSGTISNDDANPAPTAGADTLIFTPSQDILTGLGGVDTFRLIDLKNSLFVSGTTLDKVTTFVTTEDRFDSPFRTTAVAPIAAGSVVTLDASGIASRLNTSRFVANGAATFTFGSGSSLRTFLGINNNVAGYQSANDAIIEITGFSGALTSLRVL